MPRRLATCSSSEKGFWIVINITWIAFCGDAAKACHSGGQHPLPKKILVSIQGLALHQDPLVCRAYTLNM